MNSTEVRGRRVSLMFQDEARFGRMVRIRRCWARSPERPTVCNGYEREFVYVYGAVSPIEGGLDWMICREMNTARMTEFLEQVSAAHAKEFMSWRRVASHTGSSTARWRRSRASSRVSRSANRTKRAKKHRKTNRSEFVCGERRDGGDDLK